jgi:hypothetical protein
MKCFKILFFVLLTFVIVSCSDDNEDAKSSENQILNFKIGELEKVNPTGDFEFLMPFDTEVTKLKPEIAVSEKATISPKSGQEQDFTNPVIYTVMAENGTTRRYKVSVVLGEAPDIEVEAVESSYIEQGKTITLRGTFAQQKDLNEVVLIKKTTESKAANYNSVKANSVKDTQGAISLEIVSLSEDFKTIIVRVPANTPQGEYILQVSVGNKVTTYEKAITILNPSSDAILEQAEETKEYLMGENEVVEVVVKNLPRNEYSQESPFVYKVSYSLDDENAEPYKTLNARVINATETPGGNLVAILGVPIWNTTPGVNYVRIIGGDGKQTNPIKVVLKENTNSVPVISSLIQEEDYILVEGTGFADKAGFKSQFVILPEGANNRDWAAGNDVGYGPSFYINEEDIVDRSNVAFRIPIDKLPPFRSFNMGVYVNGRYSKPGLFPISPNYNRLVPILKGATPLTPGVITGREPNILMEITGDNLFQLDNIQRMIGTGIPMSIFIYRKHESRPVWLFQVPHYEIKTNHIEFENEPKETLTLLGDRAILPSDFPVGSYDLLLQIGGSYLTNSIDLGVVK